MQNHVSCLSCTEPEKFFWCCVWCFVVQLVGKASCRTARDPLTPVWLAGYRRRGVEGTTVASQGIPNLLHAWPLHVVVYRNNFSSRRNYCKSYPSVARIRRTMIRMMAGPWSLSWPWQISKKDMDRLVMNYFVVEGDYQSSTTFLFDFFFCSTRRNFLFWMRVNNVGYKDAAEQFAMESKTGGSLLFVFVMLVKKNRSCNFVVCHTLSSMCTHMYVCMYVCM